MERGDAICLESNHVFFTKWLDNLPVHMISNFLAVDPKHEVKRRFHGSREKIKSLVLLSFRSTTNIWGESI